MSKLIIGKEALLKKLRQDHEKNGNEQAASFVARPAETWTEENNHRNGATAPAPKSAAPQHPATASESSKSANRRRSIMTKLTPQEVAALDRKYNTFPGVPYSLAVVLEAAGDHKKLEESIYRVTCPIHENGNESHPSLDVKYDSKTKNILLHCKVCGKNKSYPDFLEAWGLKPTDLVETVPRHEVAAYPYHSKDRKLLYHKVRYEPKDFRYRRPNGKLGIKGIDKTLYRLPGLLADPSTVAYIVEGEKDVDTLTDRGRTATTAGGTGDWRPEFNQYFKDRDVVIIADNHPEGKKCANDTAAELWPVAASVKVVILLDKHKGDTTDFFGADGTEEQFDLIVSETPVLSEAPVVEKSDRRAIMQGFDEMEDDDLEWLWPNRIPLGCYSLINGDQDVGKSLTTLFMAGVVSNGGTWPDAPDFEVERGSVIVLSLEDIPEKIIKPRLKAVGADLSKIKFIGSKEERNKDGELVVKDLYDLTVDCDLLARAVDQLGDVRLVIVDPITGFAGGKEQNSAGPVREYLTPLARLAAEKNFALVGLSHLNKDSKKQAVHRNLGSGAWTQLARAVWVVVYDQDIEDRRLFLPIKINPVKHKDRSGLAFTPINTQVVVKGKERGHPACVFEPGTIKITADEALDTESKKKKQDAVTEVVEWLTEFLEAGPRTAEEVEATRSSNSYTKRNLAKAVDKIGVIKDPIKKKGKVKGWSWALPS